MKDVSVIIVNYNTLNLTKDCIDSVFEHTKRVEFEVIVVDNNSTDGSKYVLATDDRIVFIQSPQNEGFGRANNLGYEHSNGNFILFLNSDTLLIDDAISIMADFLRYSNENIGCVGSLLINSNKEEIFSYGKFPEWYDEFIGRKPESNYQTSYPAFVDTISGADLMVRRSVIEKHGLFDPDFFMYYEDTELMRRYHRCGVKAVVIGLKGIIHLEGSSSKVSSKKCLIQSDGFLKYIEKSYTHGTSYIKSLILAKRIITGFLKPWPFTERIDYVKNLFKL